MSIERIIQTCNKNLVSSPEDARLLYLRANAFMRLGDLETALADCSKHLLITPESLDGYYLRGCIYQRLRKIDQAICDFSRVLEQDPTHFNAKVARASCFNYIGDIDKALQDYQEGLEQRSPTRRKLHNMIAEKSSIFESSNLFFEASPSFTSPSKARTCTSPRSMDRSPRKGASASKRKPIHLIYRSQNSPSKLSSSNSARGILSSPSPRTDITNDSCSPQDIEGYNILS